MPGHTVLVGCRKMKMHISSVSKTSKSPHSNKKSRDEKICMYVSLYRGTKDKLFTEILAKLFTLTNEERKKESGTYQQSYDH